MKKESEINNETNNSPQLDRDSRKDKIYTEIANSQTAVNASQLGKKFGVSRQAVVGDIALLRASGHNIIATSRGYILENTLINQSKDMYVNKIACKHKPEDTYRELSLIVENGGKIIDVMIEHEIYGQIVGQLNITDKDDILLFMENLNKSNDKPLSDLTEGIHVHTIACKSLEDFNNIKQILTKEGFLLNL